MNNSRHNPAPGARITRKTTRCLWCGFITPVTSNEHAHTKHCYVVLRYVDAQLAKRRAKHSAMTPEMKAHLLDVRSTGRVPAEFSKRVQRKALAEDRKARGG
jgi:hypothetical protein